MILFVDTETTGLPARYGSIGDQPYVVQIAAVLCDDARQPVARINFVIRPDGWVIPIEATAIHGFTTDYCRRHGIPLATAMAQLLSLWMRANRVVSYNIDFDHWMLDVSARRVRAFLPERDLYCAMRQSAKVINGNGRWVKLGIAYQCFFGRCLDNAHDANVDVEACRAIYYAITDTLAPVNRLVGDVRSMSGASLRRAISGASEVEEHGRLIHSLSELHCTPLMSVDWRAIATEPAPHAPAPSSSAEQEAMHRLQAHRPGWFARAFGFAKRESDRLQAALQEAKEVDRREYENALAAHKKNVAMMKQRRQMAARILSGNLDAYAEVMNEIDLCASPLLGRQVIYSFPDAASAEVFAYLNGIDVIPEKTKTLLNSGRVSSKKRTKRDLKLLYQDHLCSAILRLGRDFFARLPVTKVLLHGFIPETDTSTGQPVENCVVSVLLTRDAMSGIQFNKIDTSDCVSSFPHAMKTSRGAMVEVTPITFEGVPPKTLNRQKTRPIAD
jgi:DNA polymerase III epsilon subunit-like protein